MARLLAVVVLCCSGLFMFATCSDKNGVSPAAKYEIRSLACETFKNTVPLPYPICESDSYLFWRRFCSYMCDGQGKLLTLYCMSNNKLENYPSCNDLVCRAVDAEPTSTTEAAAQTDLQQSTTTQTTKSKH